MGSTDDNISFDLFLSHNSADKAWTERLAVAVEADRSGPPLRVFFDKWDISPGSDIPSELEQGLQKSRHIGLVLSPESLASDWVALERSTAIYRDPSARQRRLLPLLRRDCSVPDMLARLSYIDFRLSQDFDKGVDDLIAVLRGKPSRRGGNFNIDEVYLREDAALLKRHRRMFDRPAFRTPCIYELFIRELLEAIDDTAAAINTGSLYSRSGKLLSEFPDKSDYILPNFKQAFSRINKILTTLKRAVVEFESFFRNADPSYSHHINFYAMLMDYGHRNGEPVTTHKLVAYMDKIDQLRNDILDEFGRLLSECGEESLERIPLTSEVIKSRSIGGSGRIADILRMAGHETT